MSIISIDIAKLRNSEFLQFCKDFLAIVQRNNPVTLNALTEYNDLNLVTSAIDALFKTGKGSILTQDIIDLDTRRDNAITGISALILALTYHYDTTIANAANTLAFHLKNYGPGIARENYQSETAINSNIVSDWLNKPDLSSAVTTLQLDGWRDELDTSNTAFNTLYLNRTQDLATVSDDTIQKKRLEATEKYYALRNMIEAWFTINQGAHPFDKATQECNALITQYNTLIAGRKSTAGTTDTPPVAPVS